jgi:alpha-beta hydrolase superfamily lysophospholipase
VKQTKLYEEATHTLDFEPDPTAVFGDMRDFLDGAAPVIPAAEGDES